MAKTKLNITFVFAAVVFCFIQNTISQSIGINNCCGNPNSFISNGINGFNINNGNFNGINGLNNGIGCADNFGPGIGNFIQTGPNNIALAGNGPTSSVGFGDVAIVGELPVGGATAVTGNVPVIGYVTFEGTVPAGGLVSVAAGCGCNGELVNYLA